MSEKKYEPTLFIGGPKDGEVCNVDRSMYHLRYLKGSQLPRLVDPIERIHPNIETVDYYSVRFRGGEASEFVVYVVHGMTVKEVFEALFARYAKVPYAELFREKS